MIKLPTYSENPGDSYQTQHHSTVENSKKLTITHSKRISRATEITHTHAYVGTKKNGAAATSKPHNHNFKNKKNLKLWKATVSAQLAYFLKFYCICNNLCNLYYSFHSNQFRKNKKKKKTDRTQVIPFTYWLTTYHSYELEYKPKKPIATV